MTTTINHRPQVRIITTTVNGQQRYIAYETSRHAAFMAVARQLAAAGHVRF